MEDWLRQAEYDLNAARTTLAASQFDWACFSAQQAAGKALKALYLKQHAEGWGHILRRLIEGLSAEEPGLHQYLEKAMILDKYHIPTRYPNGLDAGAPADAYTKTEAEQAILYAEDITRFCQARCRTSP